MTADEAATRAAYSVSEWILQPGQTGAFVRIPQGVTDDVRNPTGCTV